MSCYAGVLLSRVTLTASRCQLYPFGTAHFLTGECSWAVEQFLKQEEHAYPEQPFAEPQHVTTTAALHSTPSCKRCIRRRH
eukprot:6212128-Pleurochrysis_carterae.AAC.1